MSLGNGHGHPWYKRILCALFGHKWTYWDWQFRECKRCGRHERHWRPGE